MVKFSCLIVVTIYHSPIGHFFKYRHFFYGVSTKSLNSVHSNSLSVTDVLFPA